MKTMLLMIMIQSSLLLAQMAEAPAEASQFQFSVGDWDAWSKSYDPATGKLVKEGKACLQVSYLNDKRMIFEQWTSYDEETGKVSYHGTTLRSYSEKENQWRAVFFQTYQQGVSTHMTFHKEKDEMIGRWETKHLVRGVVLFRIRFFNIEKDSFSWESKLSIDYGKTWHLESTYTAKRRG